MKNKINKFFSGYIEGYYGKYLSWSERLKIINALNKNQMNFYFYAPKEDVQHRFNWKKPYKKNWIEKFSSFSSQANFNGISIIAGIAPGLNYNFDHKSNNQDFEALKKKSLQLKENGANFIALMFDDIPNNFVKIYGKKKSEGKTHAEIANSLANELQTKIFVVPRIYANELNFQSPNYIFEFGRYLQKDIAVFHCGKKIVSQTLNQNMLTKLQSIINNQLIFWDNLFANDYCPRRLFISPWYNRNLDNIMINPTGMIQTDLLILDIISNKDKNINLKSTFLKSLKTFGVPDEFKDILHYFENPVFNSKYEVKKLSTEKEIHIIDKLLWEWKSKLSIEWYPFLMGLKQDILIKNNKLNRNRIIKTQNKPLSSKILDLYDY